MTIFVADTHALAFFLSQSPRLSAPARDAFRAADSGKALMIVSTIVLAELGWMIERGRLHTPLSSVIVLLKRHPYYEIAPIEVEHVECAFNTMSELEMHDRLIVCEAKFRNAPLITSDSEIHASGYVPVLW